MIMWSPWRGCRKHSAGCKFCYIHKGDARRGIDTGLIIKTDNFYAPIAKKKNGEYKITTGQTVYVCFSGDFLIDEADAIFNELPIRHKNIICQPLIEAVDLTPYLKGIELVVVGGESDKQARPLDFDWVLDIRQQCVESNVPFEFRQCGTHFIKDGRTYTINVRQLMSQARKANINT